MKFIEIDPPYPSDLEAKGWNLALDYRRIDRSDTWAIATSEQKAWLLMLWFKAWQQSPIASLPNDDRLISGILGLNSKKFSEWSDVLLRGWQLASDGRLYHKTLTSHVLLILEKERKKSNALRDLRDRDGYRMYRDHVLSRDGFSCVYCKATGVPLQLDHVTPKSRGGVDCPSNLVAACKPCNTSKGARTPQEWGLR